MLGGYVPLRLALKVCRLGSPPTRRFLHRALPCEAAAEGLPSSPGHLSWTRGFAGDALLTSTSILIV